MTAATSSLSCRECGAGCDQREERAEGAGVRRGATNPSGKRTRCSGAIACVICAAQLLREMSAPPYRQYPLHLESTSDLRAPRLRVARRSAHRFPAARLSVSSISASCGWNAALGRMIARPRSGSCLFTANHGAGNSPRDRHTKAAYCALGARKARDSAVHTSAINARARFSRIVTAF